MSGFEKGPREPFPSDVAGKLATASSYKDQGNNFFKEANYKKALVKYNTALAFTKGLPGRNDGMDGMVKVAQTNSKVESLSEEEDKLVKDFEIVVKTNIATCHVKLGNAEKALDAANSALALDPTAWKSLLRKAEAIMLKKDNEKALTVLDQALSYAPEDSKANVLKVKQKASQLFKKDLEKQRKDFSKMFKSDGKTGDNSESSGNGKISSNTSSSSPVSAGSLGSSGGSNIRSREYMTGTAPANDEEN